MSFSKIFQSGIYEPWRKEYANLNKLDSTHWTSEEFQDFVQSEVEKVKLFIAKKQREIESRIAYSERNSRTRTELDEILLDLNELSKFTRLNFLALEKFTFDVSAFDTQRFDPSLVKVCKQIDALSNTTQVPHKAKFWVHPDHLGELQAILLFYLSASNPETVSRVYFDSPSFDRYKACLQYDPGAKPITKETLTDKSDDLQPTMRVIFTRTIFGNITLDTHLEFTRLEGNETFVLPYAVLNLSEIPYWLTGFVQSRWVCELPRFSKYVQGSFHFWKNQLPLVPWWLKCPPHVLFDDKKEYGIGYLEHQLQCRSRGYTTQEPYPIFTPQGSQVTLKENVIFHDSVSIVETVIEEKPLKQKEEKKKKKVEIEPKVFMANERTFIHWLHFASTLLNVAVTLMNFGDGVNRTVGIVFFVIAFLFATYSFGFFRWRAYRILKKPHLRFDDMFGPVFLCILLTGSLVLNFVLRFNTPVQDNTYLGINSTSDSTS